MRTGFGIGCGMGMVAGAIVVGGVTIEPTIFLDFKNGVYTVEGAATPLADIVEASESFPGWDATKVVPGTGLTAGASGNDFRLKKALFTALGNEATIVPHMVQASSSNPTLTISMMDDPDFNNMFPLVLNAVDDGNVLTGARISVSDGGGTFVADVDAGVLTYKAAFSATPERVAGSLNGRAVIAMDTYNAGQTGIVPFDTSVVTINQHAILESIGWYSLQAEADLPGLSA
jgi:hypothetical protein